MGVAGVTGMKTVGKKKGLGVRRQAMKGLGRHQR